MIYISRSGPHLILAPFIGYYSTLMQGLVNVTSAAVQRRLIPGKSAGLLCTSASAKTPYATQLYKLSVTWVIPRLLRQINET